MSQTEIRAVKARGDLTTYFASRFSFLSPTARDFCAARALETPPALCFVNGAEENFDVAEAAECAASNEIVRDILKNRDEDLNAKSPTPPENLSPAQKMTWARENGVGVRGPKK